MMSQIRAFKLIIPLSYLLFVDGLVLNAAATKSINKIHAHILIGDFQSACIEAKKVFTSDPSATSFEAYLKALSKAGREKELWMICSENNERFKESLAKREILEEIAWGIIESGYKSSSPMVRVLSLLGSFFGQDTRGVQNICKGMHDSNVLIRGIAVKLAGHMKDAKLQDEVLRLFREEKSWAVRLEVIKAIGSMEIQTAKPDLIKLIADDHNSTEDEKTVAIEALTSMVEHAEREDVIKMSKSDRSGLRLLACEIIETLDLTRDADLLIQLTKDRHAKVRMSAWRALGVLRVSDVSGQSIQALCDEALKDRDPYVAITAAWVLALSDPQRGQKALKEWIHHEDKKISHFAAGVLSATGKYGLPSIQELFFESHDPYVKMNLALGLLKQRRNTEEACEALFHGFTNISDRWMWDEAKGFKVLTISRIKFDDSLITQPETVNQLVRLELLNILAIMKYPKAQEAIRCFLQEKAWGLTGSASALLLTECDETASKLVEELLSDPDHKIRVQAALVLALWGGGEEAINVLKEAYSVSDRMTKERILEGLGNVGSPATIPFLVEKLQEPFQSMRIIAAAALLQSLYH